MGAACNGFAGRNKVFPEVLMKHTIPPRSGKAHRLEKGQSVRVINTHGNQVVDFWALMPMISANTWGWNTAGPSGPTFPVAGTRWSPTAPPHPYPRGGQFARPPRHPDRPLRQRALRPLGLHPLSRQLPGQPPCGPRGARDHHSLYARLAQPVHEHPWHPDGKLDWGNCLCKPGDNVVFKAEMDAIVAFSACPQDMLPINNGTPTEAHYEIF